MDRNTPVEARRALQLEVGLEALPRLQLVETEDMASENTTKAAQTKAAPRRNEQQDVIRVVREMVMDDMGFKAIALRELKRAAVWVPILITTGLGTLWASKRLLKL